MDFFSILLPGALLTFVLMDRVDPAVISGRFATLHGAEGWAAFLIASYLAGHLAFLLGSWLDGVTHAGGVVVRGRGPHARYLLVEAKNDRTQWVLPKGHIEASARAKAPAARERPEETAIREVHEETGVWASIRADLHDVSYAVNGTTLTVRFFLMDYAGRGLRHDADRAHAWLPLDEALTKATHRETRDLLQAASRLVAVRATASAVD